MDDVQINAESAKVAAYKELKSKLSEFMKTDLIRAEISIKTLLAKKKFLTKSTEQLKKRIPLLENKIMAIDLKEKQIRRIKFVLKDQFFMLSSKVQETRIAVAEIPGDIKLISKAIEPHFPVSPNRLQIILTTLVFSLVVGVAASLAKEHLDTAKQNTKE